MLKSECYLFADDTKLYSNFFSHADQDQLQEDLDALCKWSKIWRLNYHPDTYMVLSLCMLRNNKKEYYYKFKCGNNVYQMWQ